MTAHSGLIKPLILWFNVDYTIVNVVENVNATEIAALNPYGQYGMDFSENDVVSNTDRYQ